MQCPRPRLDIAEPRCGAGPRGSRRSRRRVAALRARRLLPGRSPTPRSRTRQATSRSRRRSTPDWSSRNAGGERAAERRPPRHGASASITAGSWSGAQIGVSTGVVMPRSTNSAEPLLLLVRRAEDEDLADQVLGRQLARPLAVPAVPGLDHRVDRLAPAEPAEELLVDGHGRVGGEHPARERQRLVGRLRDAEEAAQHVRDALRLAGLALAGADLGHHLCRRPTAAGS